jgi:3-deoxy-D-manno-octulosonic-acid transferase
MNLSDVLMAERRPVPVLVYMVLARLAVPLYWLVHFFRCRTGKDDPARSKEKFGRPAIPRPRGRLIWIHAASVGETTSVQALIEALVRRGYQVLLTTVTRTSAELAGKRLPDGAFHQYVPFDSPVFLRPFLSHWQPDVAMTVESEIWPASFMEVRRLGIPFVLLNGRMSDRSFKGWWRLKSSAAYLFGSLDLAFAQSPADMSRLKKLGCRQVACPGNLKFDAPSIAAEPNALKELEEAVGERPVWLAALTHPGEEEIALSAHRELRSRHPDSLLLLVPRHPNRADAVAGLVARDDFSVCRRSLGEMPDQDTEVYLGDTLGEMALFYALAPVAFLGGSFAEVGGHNPLEAASGGAAIISGPNVANARAVYKALWEGHAACRLEKPEELAASLEVFLADPVERERQAVRAREIVEGGRGALDRTLERLGPYLPQPGSSEIGGGSQ